MASLRNLAIGLLRLAGHTQIVPTLRWVNRNPARALAFLGLPMHPLTPKSDHAEVLDAPGTGIPISHQRHAMGTLFDVREHKMAPKLAAP